MGCLKRNCVWCVSLTLSHVGRETKQWHLLSSPTVCYNGYCASGMIVALVKSVIGNLIFTVDTKYLYYSVNERKLPSWRVYKLRGELKKTASSTSGKSFYFDYHNRSLYHCNRVTPSYFRRIIKRCYCYVATVVAAVVVPKAKTSRNLAQNRLQFKIYGAVPFL